jgi:PAS domain S-box-containing protein
VGVIGPAWHRADLVAARELLLDNAVACVEVEELTPASLGPAILAALDERARLVETPFGGQLLHMLPDPVYFKDRHGRFLAGNQALARSFKLTDPALLVGRSDADFLVASYAQKTLAEEQEIIRTGQPLIALSEKATYEQQETRWWLTWKSPLRDSTGRIIGTFGFSRDQTDLKTTEIALTTERHLLEVLLTGLPDAVFIKDREGRFLLANQMVAYWMGNSPTSLRGQRDVDVYPAEIALAFRKDEEAVMVSGMPMVNKEERVLRHFQWVILMKTGKTQPK